MSLTTKSGSILFRPPPSAFYDPQLQIICCYIARYWCKKIARAPGGHKKLCLGGGGGNRIDPKILAATVTLKFDDRNQTSKLWIQNLVKLNPIKCKIVNFKGLCHISTNRQTLEPVEFEKDLEIIVWSDFLSPIAYRCEKDA